MFNPLKPLLFGLLALALADPLVAAEADAAQPSLLERWFGGKEGPDAYRQDADFALYQQACSDCHLAYPPGLLPGSSWQRIMGGLADHFGQKAALDDASVLRLQAYLLRHATEKSAAPYAQQLARTAGYKPINLRITESEYFSIKHQDISLTEVKANPRIGSLSQCQACHSKADQGSFKTDEVVVPAPE
ncbi:MAG: diheme cytochrome c [Gammaproteobacteria bacterium SHHR-1]|uniref:diheme cytochrome c n=1 Tax=Magnetovirga frankeli TaxID=947516 RepID=UPI001AF609AC|nr:diheme cytochrome c [gamma proteobacterium SS-5]